MEKGRAHFTVNYSKSRSGEGKYVLEVTPCCLRPLAGHWRVICGVCKKSERGRGYDYSRNLMHLIELLQHKRTRFILALKIQHAGLKKNALLCVCVCVFVALLHM